MRNGKRLVAVAVAAGCVAAGALGGITSGSAATKTAKTAKTAAGAAAGMRGGPHGAVHSESVVLNRAGTAYETVVSDEGTLTAVSGTTLTIEEGTGTVTYKTVMVSVPSGATVVRNGKTAALGDLKTGDRVRVSVADDGSAVMADDGTFTPGDGQHGRGGPGGPGGPPPATTTG